MIGETLGTYRILSEIGKGGMGVVYMAEHTLLGRKAALKVLRSDLIGDHVERFFNEAKAAAKLHHPGLVDVFDFGHHDDGSAFIVMEYLQGESLAERLERDKRLPMPIACSIARSVALSLAVAHAQGIVHRDLKPANIFLVPDADAAAGVRTKVLDFGIAKLVGNGQTGGVNTASGAVIGTPRYMSPEQCKNSKSVDGRSDIYSLGCILYEMVLGVAPFEYTSWAELVGAHIYEEARQPTEIDPTVPNDVETVICTMMEKAPEKRFASMQSLAESLENVLRTHGAAPVRLTPPGRIATPAGGLRRLDSSQDATLPAASGERAAIVTDKRAGTEPTVSAAPTIEKRRPPWVAIGLGVAGAGALAIAGALVLGKSKDSEATEPTYVVVNERGSAAEKPIEPAVATVDAAVEQTTVMPDAGTGTPAKAPPADSITLLTRAFGKQRDAIAKCFDAHPTTYEGQLQVRLEVNKAGTVTGARVIPDSIGATPLGTCIVEVSKRATFGPQPKAIAFKVPVVTENR
jgi:eukaryotic-like serine/threonine-protein kinase